MDQMTPETLGPDDLRRLADLLERPTRYGATTARDGMRVCAAAWEAEIAVSDRNYEALLNTFAQAQAADRARIEALERARMLAISEWSTWKDVLVSNMTEADWRETMDGLRAPAALAEED